MSQLNRFGIIMGRVVQGMRANSLKVIIPTVSFLLVVNSNISTVVEKEKSV